MILILPLAADRLGAALVSIGMGLLVCYGLSLLLAQDSATARQPASAVWAKREASGAF